MKNTLRLPWSFDDFTMERRGSDLVLRHRDDRPGDNHGEIILDGMAGGKKDIDLIDVRGKRHKLEMNPVAHLAIRDGRRLTLLAAAEGGQLLKVNDNGAGDPGVAAVINDMTGLGNVFQGIKNVRNLMVARGGNNTFMLGNKGDEAHSGRGEDHYYSGTGNDLILDKGGHNHYYFGRQHGHDRLMVKGVQSLHFTASGLEPDDISLSVSGTTLEIRTKGNESNLVEVDAWEGRIRDITLGRWHLKGADISALMEAVAGFSAAERNNPHSRQIEDMIQRYWTVSSAD